MSFIKRYFNAIHFFTNDAKNTGTLVFSKIVTTVNVKRWQLVLHGNVDLAWLLYGEEIVCFQLSYVYFLGV